MSIQVFYNITSFAVAVWESPISQAGRIYNWHWVHSSLAQCLMFEWSLCWPWSVLLTILHFRYSQRSRSDSLLFEFDTV